MAEETTAAPETAVASEPNAAPESPPPATEAVHLPSPSYLPAALAAGVALALVGLVVSPILVVGGVAISLPVLIVWIRSARQDIAELPLEQ